MNVTDITFTVLSTKILLQKSSDIEKIWKNFRIHTLHCIDTSILIHLFLTYLYMCQITLILMHLKYTTMLLATVCFNIVLNLKGLEI